jgi:cell volume regulation protein A
MLEFESGSNDPMAYLLTLTFLHLIQNPDTGWGSQLVFFAMQVVLGLALGFAMGWLGKRMINRIRIEYDVIYTILVIALIFLTYSVTTLLHGSGFLAVYVFALYLGNQKLIHRKTILKMFDGFAWLMQIVIFISLGLLVFPSRILPVMGIGLLISIFLMFVARPVGVFLCLLPFKMKLNKRFFVSWVGLKGAVPIVMATFPLVAGLPSAEIIFNIIFFVSVSSVLVQGTTLGVVAKWLKVAQPFHKKRRISIDIEDAGDVKSRFAKVMLPPASAALGIPLVELGLPQKATISLIIRGDKYITPYGATTLECGDRLLIVSDDALSLTTALERLGAKENEAEWGDM